MMMNIAINIVYMKIGTKAHIIIKSKVQKSMLDIHSMYNSRRAKNEKL